MFTIEKDLSGIFWHIYNNARTRVNVSDFDVVIDSISQTFIIQCKNGSNIPSQAIAISLMQVIDLNVGTSPIPFSGADGLIQLLMAKNYTPYLQDAPSQSVYVYRVGQVGVFTMTPTQFTNNFNSTGLGTSTMIGWALRNGNNGTKNQQGKFSLNKGASPYDVIGTLGGSANSVLIGHDHDMVNVMGGAASYGAPSGGNVYVATTKKTSIKGISNTGADAPSETGVGKNMPPYLIDVWVERVTDLIINSGSGGGGGGGVQTVTGVTVTGTATDRIVGVPTLNQVLTEDNETGGENILINDADAIELENGSKLSQGIVDAGTGGNKGIALTCAVGFEWKFEAGEAYLTETTSGYISLKQYARSLPSVNDDITKGFISGSKWYSDNFTYFYECTDPTTGAAVWVQNFGTTPTLQEVLDNNHDLVDGNNFQGTGAGLGNSNNDVNAFGTNAATNNGGPSVNALGNNAATNNVGANINSFGVNASLDNQGDNINAFGTNAANGNTGSGVNALGSGAGEDNLFNNVNLFGSNANADEDNQTVFSKNGTIMARVSTTELTDSRKYTLQDADGTLAFLSDITGGGTVTSVGLTMPSAFKVTNSPITSSGDIAVTGDGAVSQYVRGDGSLANFPTSSGGGSSLSFYLNGSVSQGTFGGVAFKEMDRTPILGAGTDFTINANGYIQSFITDAGVPNQLEIPAGNWNFETYFSASSGGGSPSFYVELYKWDGTTLSLIASSSATPENITGGTSIDLYVSALAVPQTTLLATDRLAVRIYVTHSGRTITLHTENSHLCQIITTFSTGLTALNGLTAQVQNLAVGTTGTDFGINSTTATHTFNLPTASASNRGALSSADWTTFNSKQNTATLIFDSIQKAIMRDNYFWFVPNNISTGVAAGFGYSERLMGNTFTIAGNGNLLRGLMAFNTTATAGTIAFMRRHDSMILTGLEVVFTRKIQFNSNVSGQRFFCGISKGNQFSAPTNVEPSTLTDIVGVCQLSSSTNMHVVHNDASGTATTIDLGSSYPCTDSQYNYYITIEQTITSYIVTVERVTVSTGASISTTNTLSTNIPNYATGTIQLLTWISNNATAAVASYLDGGAIGNVKNQ
jgi:hypothetical protein